MAGRAVDRVDEPAPSAILADLFALVRRGIELDLRVSAPAHVVSYNPTTQTATVQLGALPVAIVRGEDVVQDPIVIPDVPVRWLGAGSNYVTMPLPAGSTGHVVFTDRCLAVWRRTGQPSDPISGRTHNLADAIFEPGLRNATNPISPMTDITATVVEGELVKCGRDAVDFAVLGTTHASDWLTFLGAFRGALTTLASTAAIEPAAVVFANAVGPMVDDLLAALPDHISTKVQIQ